jgi:hypothetical protein
VLPLLEPFVGELEAPVGELETSVGEVEDAVGEVADPAGELGKLLFDPEALKHMGSALVLLGGNPECDWTHSFLGVKTNIMNCSRSACTLNGVLLLGECFGDCSDKNTSFR